MCGVVIDWRHVQTMIRAEGDERGRSLSEEEEEEALECDIKGSFIMPKTGLSKVNWMGGIFISLSCPADFVV